MELLPLMQNVTETKSPVHATVPWSCAFSFPPGCVLEALLYETNRNSLTSPGCCTQKYYRKTQQFFVVPEICFIFETDKLNITCNFNIP